MIVNDTSRWRFVFWGSDLFSIAVAEELWRRGWQAAAVITVPDRPAGRGHKLTSPPLKKWAEGKNIRVYQPEKLKEFSLPEDFDFSLVASYGKIIPESLLNQPDRGTLNVHPSLLPLHRGATPLESTLLSPATETGVSIMLLDQEMDHGPLLAQEKISLASDPWYEELRDQSATLGAKLLDKVLPDYLTGRLVPTPQDHHLATYTKKISKADGLVDIKADPLVVFRTIRAFTPWPGAYFFITRLGREQRIIIKKAHLEDVRLIIDRVLPEGKKEITWQEFEKGYLTDTH